MASTSTGVVVEDSGISSSDMRDKLAEFLGGNHTREGLSEDNYTKLSRFQKALEEEIELESQTSDEREKPVKVRRCSQGSD